MNKRKQNLIRRYLKEMLMRLDMWLSERDAKRFIEHDLDRTVELKNARHNLKLVLGHLEHYQEEHR